MTVPDLHENLVWRCIGPFRGGRSVAVAGDPIDRNTFYVGTTGGGVWKTVDGGTYWRNVSDGFFKRASVGAVAVAPADPNVIYAGMGETTIRGNVSHGDGVYGSTDAGRTWKHLGLEATRGIGKVRVDPRNPDVVFVAAFGHAHGPNPERGLYRSMDGGQNWELVLARGEDAGANDVSIDPSNPRRIFASTWEARRGPYSLTSGGPGCGLFRSVDGGDKWEDLTTKPGMPEGLIGKIGVVVSPAKPGRVWAIIEHEKGGVFRSDDDGETWERLNEDRKLRQRAWYYSHIYADPKDAETVWVLNVEMFRSDDGGKTFHAVPAPHGDNHDLWIDPNDPARMILGNDGGGTVSYTGGVSWTPQYSQPTAEFYHVTADSRVPYRVYGSQQDNTSMSVPSRSDHDVITVNEWYAVGGGEAGYIAVRPDNPNIVYAGEYMGIMTRYDHATGHTRVISVWPEDNSGSGAKDYKYRFQWTYPIVLSPHDPNVLYCGGNHVFRTIDEGSSWDVISPDLTRNDPTTMEPSGGEITKDNTGAEIYGTVFALAESPVTKGVLWAGSDDGLVHVSRDGGETWEDVTPPGLPEWSLISLIEASPHAEGTAYLAANRYKHDDFRPFLFKTDDLGKTWTRISSNLPQDDFTRVIREDPEVPGLLFAGTETGVYVSYDDGAKWNRLQGNFPVVPVHDLVISQDDLVVGTHGRSFWILDDLTLFRQITRSVMRPGKARLFAPRETTRFESTGSFGHDPVKGQNYWFASTMVPAYDHVEQPDDEPKKQFLDAGENPPDGVVVYYYLPEKELEIALTVRDADGKEVNTFGPKPKKPETVSDRNEEELGPDDEPEGPFITRRAGLNRFIWNLQGPKATKIATKGGHQPDRNGPRVPPGRYTIELRVGEETLSEPVTIVPDPRGHRNQADLTAQYELAHRIWEKHDEINKTVNAIRKAREGIAIWSKWANEAGNAGSVVDRAKLVTEKLDEIEGELLQRQIQSLQDSLNYPIKLNSKLVSLGWEVAYGIWAPTQGAKELFEQLESRTNELLAAFEALKSGEITALNAEILNAKLTPVAVETEKMVSE
jgi:photosystem II stability/assembly factor-like uncharacterized protein